MMFSWSILAVVLIYIWVVVPVFAPGRVLGLAPVVLVLALAGWKAAREGEWGLNWTHLRPALFWSALITIPAVPIIAWTGSALGLFNPRSEPFKMLFFLLFWGTGQQFALQVVFLREAQAATSPRRGIWVAAALFALLHLPNPFLVPLTFIGGLIYCSIFYRYPNLIPLGISHGLISWTIIQSLDRQITGGMRVGYSYLLLERPAWIF